MPVEQLDKGITVDAQRSDRGRQARVPATLVALAGVSRTRYITQDSSELLGSKRKAATKWPFCAVKPYQQAPKAHHEEVDGHRASQNTSWAYTLTALCAARATCHLPHVGRSGRLPAPTWGLAV